MIKFLEQNSRRNLAETYPRGFCKRFLQEVSARGLGRAGAGCSRRNLAETPQKPRRNPADQKRSSGTRPLHKPLAETSCRNIPQKPRRNLCRNLLQKHSQKNLIITITVILIMMLGGGALPPLHPPFLILLKAFLRLS